MGLHRVRREFLRFLFADPGRRRFRRRVPRHLYLGNHLQPFLQKRLVALHREVSSKQSYSSSFSKYWNFLTGLAFGAPQHNPAYWAGAFLPLGISFFTFEFIHYAVDRYRGTTQSGKFSDYMAFILFFPTMVAGPIKRYQTFLPTLREPSLEWSNDWRIGMTRILVGLAKKFAIADLMTAFTNHLNHNDIAKAQQWVLHRSGSSLTA